MPEFYGSVHQLDRKQRRFKWQPGEFTVSVKKDLLVILKQPSRFEMPLDSEDRRVHIGLGKQKVEVRNGRPWCLSHFPLQVASMGTGGSIDFQG